MKKRTFQTATPEEILKGKTTDIYFVRALKTLEAKGLAHKRAAAEFTAGAFPGGAAWAVFNGLDEALTLLEKLPLDVWAMPEGTLFPAQDVSGVKVPVMLIEGPYGRFCLLETPLLGLICQATGVATKAARIRESAADATLLGFGARRMHPAIAPMLDRASYCGGLDGVSCVLGAQMLGLTPRGTMPHAMIIAFSDQEKAWKAWDDVTDRSVPRVLLIDTYSDEKEEALKAAKLLGKKLKGVRIDTPGSRRGNLPELVREIRWELDLRGHSQVGIFVSGGLDEEQIPALRAAGASGFGVGTSISNAPSVNFAMDLVEWEGKPCAKRGKYSGTKQVWICATCLYTRVQLMSEKSVPTCKCCQKKLKPVLKPVLKRGKRVGDRPKVDQIRQRVLSQLKTKGCGCD